ncbi:hypothetical protein [Oceanirhabdus sp. W0125-5]|nr:hypothetical protein [Oceanirhabdus sp. W0125-5]WBW99037.1 hypothetical protein OW730_09910 [Oceanirhabdus sp. W0125-5]
MARGKIQELDKKKTNMRTKQTDNSEIQPKQSDVKAGRNNR